MANFQQIQLTRSSTAGAIPAATDLEAGELAINTADKKLYFKNSSGTIDTINNITNASGGVLTVNESDNRLGVNQTSPTEALHVTGTIRLDGSIGKFNASGEQSNMLERKEYIQFSLTDSNDTSSGNDGARIYSDATGSNTNTGDLVLSLSDDTNEGGQSFIIRNDSGSATGGEGVGYANIACFQVNGFKPQVGIGTQDPEANLQIKNANNTVADATSDSAQRSDGATLEIWNPSDTTNSFSQLVFRNRNSNQSVARILAQSKGSQTSDLLFIMEDGGNFGGNVKIDSNGSVRIQHRTNASIGTNTVANAHLNINDNLLFDSNQIYCVDTLYLQRNTGKDFHIREGATTQLFINDGGNVGINTVTPGKRFDVNGSAIVRANFEASGDLTVGGSTVLGDASDDTVTVSGNVIAATAPSAANHLTNKSYVDTQISGITTAIPTISVYQTPDTSYGSSGFISNWVDQDSGNNLALAGTGLKVGLPPTSGDNKGDFTVPATGVSLVEINLQGQDNDSSDNDDFRLWVLGDNRSTSSGFYAAGVNADMASNSYNCGVHWCGYVAPGTSFACYVQEKSGAGSAHVQGSVKITTYNV